MIYEETIQQEGLAAFKVLVMPACDVLPQSVVTAVQAFQKTLGQVADGYPTKRVLDSLQALGASGAGIN